MMSQTGCIQIKPFQGKFIYYYLFLKCFGTFSQAPTHPHTHTKKKKKEKKKKPTHTLTQVPHRQCFTIEIPVDSNFPPLWQAVLYFSLNLRSYDTLTSLLEATRRLHTDILMHTFNSGGPWFVDALPLLPSSGRCSRGGKFHLSMYRT